MSWVLAILITFPVSGLVTSAVLVRFLDRDRPVLDDFRIRITGLMLGPVGISLWLTVLFLVFPGLSRWVYLTAVLVPVLLAAILCRQQIKDIGMGFPWRKAFSLRHHFFFKLFVGIFVLHLFLQGVGEPILTHDAVIYAAIGKSTARDCSLANYPMKKPDRVTGADFNCVWHPPGLTVLYAWFFLFQAEGNMDYGCRFVAPIYTLYLLILIYDVIRRRFSAVAAQCAMILAAFTPVLIYETAGNSIDPMRIGLFTLAFFLGSILLEKITIRLLSMVALVTLSAIFIHLGNFLLLPAFAVGCLLRFRRYRWLAFACLAVFGVLFCMLQVRVWKADPVRNPRLYFLSLNPGPNINPVRRSNAFGTDWAEAVERKSVSAIRIFWTERMQVFSAPDRFGAVFWVGIAGLVMVLLKRRKRPFDLWILVGSIAVMVPVIVKYYLNYRYVSTLVPEALYFAGGFCEYVCLSARKYRKSLTVSALSFAFAVLAVLYAAITLTGLCWKDFSMIDSMPGAEADFIRFAAWKRFTSPMALVTVHAGRENPSGFATAVTSARKDPEHYYHLPANAFFGLSSEPTRNLLQDLTPEVAWNCLRKFRIGSVIVTPDFQGNPIFSSMEKEGSLVLLEKHRGHSLYRVRSDQPETEKP